MSDSDPNSPDVAIQVRNLVKRYDGRPGTTYLIRPDQHVAARWRRLDVPALERALERASARNR